MLKLFEIKIKYSVKNNVSHRNDYGPLLVAAAMRSNAVCILMLRPTIFCLPILKQIFWLFWFGIQCSSRHWFDVRHKFWRRKCSLLLFFFSHAFHIWYGIPTEIASAECEIGFDFVFDLAHLFLKIDRWLHLILDDAIPNKICVLILWPEEYLCSSDFSYYILYCLYDTCVVAEVNIDILVQHWNDDIAFASK